MSATSSRPPPRPPLGLRRLAGWALALGTLAALQWLGERLVQAAGWPLPGALLGLLMLWGLLAWHGRVPDALSELGGGLQHHLMLFLIPSVAGLVEQAPLLAAHGPLLVGACVFTTAVTVAATALTLSFGLRRQPVDAADKGAT